MPYLNQHKLQRGGESFPSSQRQRQFGPANDAARMQSKPPSGRAAIAKGHDHSPGKAALVASQPTGTGNGKTAGTSLAGAKLARGMEQELIVRAQTGDKAAFQQLVHQSLPNVIGLSYQMLGDRTEAEDLAQEVMLSLWQNLEKYDPDRGRLSTWVYRITANRCLDRLRRKKVDQLDDDYDAPVEAEQHDALFDKQVSKEIDGAMQDLPERQQLAITLFHYQGHSMQEIGEILDCSVDAVESLLARARRSLKQSLAPLWDHVQEDEI